MSKILKIGFVLDDSLDKPDGVQQYILTLGIWLNKQGHNVHYLVGETTRTDIPNVHSLSRNVKARFNGNNMSIPLTANKQHIKALLKKEKFDILHVQMPYSPFLARQIIEYSDKSGTVIVGTFHILPYGRLHKFATKLLSIWLKNSLNRFDDVVAVSEPAKQFANQYFTPSTSVIPCTISTSRPTLIKTRGTRELVNIVFVGRLVERKGCLQLLKALRLIAKTEDAKNIAVTIAGRGSQLQKLQKYVHLHQLDSLVTFAGYVNEEQKYSLLANADIAIFPSVGGESFGIVLLEAMSASKGVVIAGNNPGYASVMDGHTKQLVNPRNTSDIADRLLYFIRHNEARSSAHTWQSDYVRKFDIDVVGPRVVEWYNQVLNQRQDMR